MIRNKISGSVDKYDLGSEVVRISLKDDDDLKHEILFLNIGALIFTLNDDRLNNIHIESLADYVKITPTIMSSVISQLYHSKDRITVYGVAFESDHHNSWTDSRNVGMSLLAHGGYLALEPSNGVSRVYFIRPTIGHIYDTRYRIRDLLDSTIRPLVVRMKENIVMTLPIDERQAWDFTIHVDGVEVEHTVLTSNEVIKSTTFMFPQGETYSIHANFTPNGFPTLIIE